MRRCSTSKILAKTLLVGTGIHHGTTTSGNGSERSDGSVDLRVLPLQFEGFDFGFEFDVYAITVSFFCSVAIWISLKDGLCRKERTE